MHLKSTEAFTPTSWTSVSWRFYLLRTSRYSVRLGGGGFSLLEMVVVLAIIGILVSIQLPNVMGNTDKAKFIRAQVAMANALTECTTAKANGYSEKELIFRNKSFLDIIPSMESNPGGYVWDNRPARGCSYMMLTPVTRDGKRAVGQGFPILMAKIVDGGRIVKVANRCRPYKGLNFTSECISWDPTINRSTWNTGRNLKMADWPRK